MPILVFASKLKKIQTIPDDTVNEQEKPVTRDPRDLMVEEESSIIPFSVIRHYSKIPIIGIENQ